MYYLKIQDEDGNIGNTLIYYCRNCGHEDTTLSTTNICVSDIQLRSSEKKYTHIVNEYTKFDPTLPRINTIKCPNQDCISNGQGGGATRKIKSKATEKQSQADKETVDKETADKETESKQAADKQVDLVNNREVIYIRYDDINMKYVYLCVHCDTTWRTDNRL
jgi:DNA-directed RNA polymerase subunit M/transcription elongation factor TFIIS